METTKIQPSIGELVALDFRIASVFKKYHIDFCCGGRQTLDEVCEQKGIDTHVIENDLQQLAATPLDPGKNFMEWDLDFLCDYIVQTHHRFVKAQLPDLLFYTQKIGSVHGEHHTELIEVAELFQKIYDELSQHLNHEEEDLFPAIKRLLKEDDQEARSSIRSEISRMLGEHDFAGGAMDHINQLTNGYAVPADGCATYQLAFKLLEQFEDDLHIHVHLENNILFPKALQLAQ